MSGGRKEPIVLSRALVDALSPLPLPERERLLLMAAWPDAVGPEVARNARAVRIDRGTVDVEVEHEAWASTIRSFEATILERLSSRAGLDVERIVTRVRAGARTGGGCR